MCQDYVYCELGFSSLFSYPSGIQYSVSYLFLPLCISTVGLTLAYSLVIVWFFNQCEVFIFAIGYMYLYFGLVIGTSSHWRGRIYLPIKTEWIKTHTSLYFVAGMLSLLIVWCCKTIIRVSFSITVIFVIYLAKSIFSPLTTVQRRYKRIITFHQIIFVSSCS